MNFIAYNKKISEISDYYGVSENCAKYLFHRAKKSLLHPTNPKYISIWPIHIQNLVVLLDQCLGVEWDNIIYGMEEEYAIQMGVNYNQTNKVFSWNDDNDGWTTVCKKKLKKRSLIKEYGLHV